ncbi:hypothetical protein LXL04_011973 [Taraxacum kok-saghyz]
MDKCPSTVAGLIGCCREELVANRGWPRLIRGTWSRSGVAEVCTRKADRCRGLLRKVVAIPEVVRAKWSLPRSCRVTLVAAEDFTEYRWSSPITGSGSPRTIAVGVRGTVVADFAENHRAPPIAVSCEQGFRREPP